MIKNYLAFFTCLFALVNCGGDDSSNGSGVSKSKKINEVTNEEAKQLCQSYSSDFADIAKSSCTFEGLMVSSTKDACEQIKSACIAQINQGSDAGADASGVECDGTDMTDMANCTTTVGDFESCMNSLVSFMKGLSCSSAGGSKPTIPSCFSTLSQKCPSLFGDVETSS